MSEAAVGGRRIGRVDEVADPEAAIPVEQLDAGRCAELLHGDRGFWVSDFIDPADPPPAYGRFAHVSLTALRNRAERVLARRPAGAL